MHDLEGLQNPQSCHWSDEFQKIRIFFRKIVLPDFGAPGCHPSTLIDFINTALAKTGSVKTKWMIAEFYRNHSVVTGPMNFKKSGHFFFRKIMLPGFWGTWLPSRLFN